MRKIWLAGVVADEPRIQTNEPDDEPNPEVPVSVPVPSRVEVTAAGDAGPNLERLWSYQCPLTKGRNVSCIAWNTVNPVNVGMDIIFFCFISGTLSHDQTKHPNPLQ